MGRVEKYPTAAQSEGFGARGRERTGHATGGLGHGALGHRVEAAGQGGGGAKNSGHLRVVARTEVLSAGRAIEFCYTVLRASTGFGARASTNESMTGTTPERFFFATHNSARATAPRACSLLTKLSHDPFDHSHTRYTYKRWLDKRVEWRGLPPPGMDNSFIIFGDHLTYVISPQGFANLTMCMAHLAMLGRT